MKKIVIFHAVLYLFYFMDEGGKLSLTIYCFVKKNIFKGNNKVNIKTVIGFTRNSERGCLYLDEFTLTALRDIKNPYNSIFEPPDGASNNTFNAGTSWERAI